MTQGVTVGILGAGQLGRMLALSGYPLGLSFRFLEVASEAPAGEVASVVHGDWHDPAVLGRFAHGLDVISYEFENLPEASVRQLASLCPLFPPPSVLAVSQDRVQEKRLFSQLAIPTTAFFPVDTEAELIAAQAQLGFPFLLKTRRFGYDGKGQCVVRTPEEMRAAWQVLGGQPLLAELFVDFDREVSLIAVRSRSGETAFYPLVENVHEHGILRRSHVSVNADLSLEVAAHAYARALLDHLNYVGVLTIEFFQCGDALIANEIAPRVHNSGHWTIEGAQTSQFENHLRAILGLPLGATAARGDAIMWNLIGELPDVSAILSIPGVHLHLYGKTPKAGRKLGHVTVCERDPTVLARLRTRLSLLIWK